MILLTSISQIIKLSLKEGKFLACFNSALVTPLLKKSNLDRNIIKNYRPVFNLSVLSMLIEKTVAAQFNIHIFYTGLANIHQSAYRSFHSTETTLLKIQNNISAALNGGNAVALTLLDLSAAVNTIDSVLLRRLHFTLYTAPLNTVISHFNVTHHLRSMLP